MKTAIIVAIAVAALTSIPPLAQQRGASAQESSSASASAGRTHVSDSSSVTESGSAGNSGSAGASANAGAAGARTEESESNDGKATYAAAGGGWGDQAASHAWEMSSISGELEGKIDSKTAKAGDRVVLKTTEKVQTSDGTLIPKGSRLIGHVTDVQAYGKEHGAATMGIAFDRVEMKGRQSIEIYTLIKGLSPSASAMAMGSGAMDSEGSFGAPMAGGPGMGGGRAGGGLIGGGGGAINGVGGGMGGAASGAAGGTLGGAGSMAGGATGGVMNRTDAAASAAAPISDQAGDRAGTGLGSTDNGVVQAAGHGDLNMPTGAHAAAAARAVPHATRVPGIMLSGSSSASGMLLASRKNIELESGTQMQLGIVAK